MMADNGLSHFNFCPPPFIKESVQIQNKEEKSLAKIQPTGIWLTEEEIIDE